MPNRRPHHVAKILIEPSKQLGTPISKGSLNTETCEYSGELNRNVATAKD